MSIKISEQHDKVCVNHNSILLLSNAYRVWVAWKKLDNYLEGMLMIGPKYAYSPT